jgi:dienelactone hydrolase
MNTTFRRAGLAVLIGAVIGIGTMTSARAQEEFPPPQGKGRVVVVLSGQTGPVHYATVTRDIAKLGYDAVLFDSNTMAGTNGAGVRAAIEKAQQMPHALPGKVALVGFSLGGGLALGYGTHWPDLVVGTVVWYPLTSTIHNPTGFARGLKVPVLMFAGENDDYRGCCLIKAARDLATAASASGAQFELVTYPHTNHDFVPGGAFPNSTSYSDALQRTAARLRQYLGN